MNIDLNINKLLIALAKKKQIYRICTFKNYNEEDKRYYTKYEIHKKDKKIKMRISKGGKLTKEYIDKYSYELSCYSKIELLQYFMEEYKKMG